MTFSKYDNDSGTNIVFDVSNYSTLGEVLEEFQNFLRACGYVIEYNKVLDLRNKDE